MIFVSVGHQMPFDRMLGLIEDWSCEQQRSDIFAQIGESDFRATHFKTQQWLSPNEYRDRLEQCSGIISHAGTGTIIQGLMLGKPILVLPRLARFSETRTDHQVGTARYFESEGLLMAAYDDADFREALNRFETFTPRAELPEFASTRLLDRVKGFIADGSGESRRGM